MDIIRNYLENMFRALEQTPEILRLKGDLLSDMEAKYNELVHEGRSQNEAIGAVISEFGNIDELVSEMDIHVEQKKSLPLFSAENVKKFLAASEKSTKLVAIGVSLILFNVAFFLTSTDGAEHYLKLAADGDLTTTLRQNLETIPIAIFLAILVPCIAMFIYSKSFMNKYKFVEKGDFELDSSTHKDLELQLEALTPKNTLSTIIGVSLIFFAVIALIFTSEKFAIESISASLFLCIVSVAVFIFSYFSAKKTALEKLLKVGEFTPKLKKTSKLLALVAILVFPIATAVYLAWSYITGDWHITWVIFPVVGICYGAFAAFYTLMNNPDSIF